MNRNRIDKITAVEEKGGSKPLNKHEYKIAEEFWNMFDECNSQHITAKYIVSFFNTGSVEDCHTACRSSFCVARLLYHHVQEGLYGRGMPYRGNHNKSYLYMIENAYLRKNPVYAYHYRELPIHKACNNGFPLSVIQCLVEEFPESVTIKSSGGMLPLHYACSIYGKKKEHRGSQSLEVVRYLIQCYPKALLVQDKQGHIPLHYAVLRCASLPLIQLLVGTCPESLTMQRKKDGTTPYELMILNFIFGYVNECCC